MAKIFELFVSKPNTTEYSAIELQKLCSMENCAIESNKEQLNIFNESLLKLVQLQLIESV